MAKVTKFHTISPILPGYPLWPERVSSVAGGTTCFCGYEYGVDGRMQCAAKTRGAFQSHDAFNHMIVISHDISPT